MLGTPPRNSGEFHSGGVISVLKVGSVTFVSGTCHLPLTISEALFMAGQSLLLMGVREDIAAVAEIGYALSFCPAGHALWFSYTRTVCARPFWVPCDLRDLPVTPDRASLPVA